MPAGDWEYEELEEAEPYEAEPYEAEPYEAADPYETEDREYEPEYDGEAVSYDYRRRPWRQPSRAMALRGVQTAVVKTPAGEASIQLPSKVATISELSRVQRDLAQTQQRLRAVTRDLDRGRRASRRRARGEARGARNAIFILALEQVRDVLREACRDSDALVRWGGDEFLVIGRASDLEGVDTLPERIRSLIERAHFDLGDGQVAHLTCSIGFTCYPAGLGDLERLSLEQVVNLADRALYAAKKAGRNAWVGLIGTPSTDIAEIERWMRNEPDSVVRADIFDVRRSDESALSEAVPASDRTGEWTAA
jgi:hypothetical protein